MAFAGVFGFGRALKENSKSEMLAIKEEVYDETTAAGKLTKAVLKSNTVAMPNLTPDHGIHYQYNHVIGI
jgi:hypothetical protein